MCSEHVEYIHKFKVQIACALGECSSDNMKWVCWRTNSYQFSDEGVCDTSVASDNYYEDILVVSQHVCMTHNDSMPQVLATQEVRSDFHTPVPKLDSSLLNQSLCL